jgi:trehalose/maltose transport system substrate-binding protein
MRWLRALVGTAIFLLIIASGNLWAATVTISCGAVGVELELCREGANAWAAQSGHEVRVVSTPSATNERLALYQQLLAAGASDIDVLQIDVIWPGLLENHLRDLGTDLGAQAGEHFPRIVENNTIGDRLVAMPWFASVPLLYYRDDLLQKYEASVPRTWVELEQVAQRIQAAEREAGNQRVWGYVWQGRAYEGLTCNALEWIAGEGGGTIVEQDGRISVSNPLAARAVGRAARWVGAITPPGVLNYAEEDSRGVFQSGNAVFMRNWPYAWALAQADDSPIRGKIGIAQLPAGTDGRSVATLGGWQLAVSRYSGNPEAAVDLVRYLVSRREQRRRALAGSFLPTIPALYKDPELVASVPFLDRLVPVIETSVARPSTVTRSKYSQVTSAVWNAVHATLSGMKDAEASLTSLQSRLQRMSRGGRAW